MFCGRTDKFTISVVVAIWTILQTSFHIFICICGHYMYLCKIEPFNSDLKLIYLSYFYTKDCKDNQPKENILTSNSSQNISGSSDIKQEIDGILSEIFETGYFPKEATAAWRTHVYIGTLIVSDFVWVLAALLLFAGSWFRVKKRLSLIFYCPWLALTAWIIILDVAASVHTGFDLIKITSVTQWLKFIGFTNYKDFEHLDDHKLSTYIFTLPTASMCALFSRLLFFWMLNIVAFYQIMQAAAVAFGEGNKTPTGKSLGYDPDVSALRIRSWQLFYGAIEATSTVSSSSSKSSEPDFNSNSKKDSARPRVRINDLTFVRSPQRDLSLESHDKYMLSSIRDESNKIEKEDDAYYVGYPDVADNVSGVVNPYKQVLKNQLPWSYTNLPIGHHSRGYPFRNQLQLGDGSNCLRLNNIILERAGTGTATTKL